MSSSRNVDLRVCGDDVADLAFGFSHFLLPVDVTVCGKFTHICVVVCFCQVFLSYDSLCDRYASLSDRKISHIGVICNALWRVCHLTKYQH